MPVKGNGGGRIRYLRPEDRAHDLLLERDVLAAFVAFPDLIIPSDVATDDFYGEANARIFAALLRLAADGEKIDAPRLRAYLYDRGQLGLIGGDDYLGGIYDGIPMRDVDIRRLRRLRRQRVLAGAASMLANAETADDLVARRAQLEHAFAALERIDGTRSPVTYRATSEIFEPLPPQSFLVPGLHLGTGRPAMWAGYGASAKTLASQALALAVAAGAPAWDHFDTVAGGGVVLHLDYEQGFRATARRYQRLAIGHGIDPGRIGNRLRTAAFPEIFLDQRDAFDAYCRACEGAALVILDAFRGATPTKDENDSSIRTCLDTLSRVSERIGCAFWVLHHAGKPKDHRSGPVDHRTGPRGSSGIFDACGAVFDVQAGKSPADPKRIHESKMPADAEGSPVPDFSLIVEDVEQAGIRTAGVRVVWAPIESAPSRVDQAEEKYDADLAHMLECVRRKAGQNQDAIVLKCGIGKPRALALLGQLEEQGRVFVTKKGKAKLYRPTDGKPVPAGEEGAA